MFWYVLYGCLGAKELLHGHVAVLRCLLERPHLTQALERGAAVVERVVAAQLPGPSLSSSTWDELG